MLAHILDFFPAHTHPLTLASDPDSLLAGEALLVELAGRGFRIVQEEDPLALRRQVEAARPFTAERSLLVVTPGALEDLPYDLWQPAQRVTLGLSRFFPHLAYPVLRTLTPRQLEKLSAEPAQPDRLARQGTCDYLLRTVFGLDLAALGAPYEFISWLARLHDGIGPLPELLAARVVELLRPIQNYRAWDLPALLNSREALANFLQREWQDYVRDPLASALSDAALPFGDDEGLQNLLPALVRKGLLYPEKAVGGGAECGGAEYSGAAYSGALPDWAQPGVAAVDAQAQRRARISTLLDELEERAAPFATPARWEEWQAAAHLWGELAAVWYAPGLAEAQPELLERFAALAARLDRAFGEWLLAHYAALGARRLPNPQHVFHALHYLAHRREQGRLARAALIVLDGMSLSDWRAIRPAWQDAHPAWQFSERLLLAQIPTITAISRRSLVSGLRPADFASDLERMPSEKELWAGFWLRAGLPREAIFFAPISLDRRPPPPEVESTRLAAVCLVDDSTDRFVHHAVLGAAGQQAALRLWLERGRAGNSEPLESVMDGLLRRGFSVFIASDHGHVEAQGSGAPAEGILAQTRGKRARLYPQRSAAQRVLESFPESVLWEDDGLLPPGLGALLPSGRMAYATPGETVVTHGGISLDEVIVPFVEISQS